MLTSPTRPEAASIRSRVVLLRPFPLLHIFFLSLLPQIILLHTHTDSRWPASQVRHPRIRHAVVPRTALSRSRLSIITEATADHKQHRTASRRSVATSAALKSIFLRARMRFSRSTPTMYVQNLPTPPCPHALPSTGDNGSEHLPRPTRKRTFCILASSIN